MRAHAAEFIGTFALVFIGCGAIANGLSPLAIAAAFGLVIMTMIYALAHVSGAHFNPAVSIGFALGGHLPWTRVVTFSLVQVTAAIAAALALRLTLGATVPLGVTTPSGSDAQALAWEAVLTFFLVLVIIAVASDERTGAFVAGVAIGGTVAMASIVGGPVSGASMNPARSIGPALVSGDLSHLWIYLVAPTAGAVAASLVVRFLNRESSPA